MNVQEVLQIMELEKLPEPSKTATIRCIALVERSSGGKDYVIASSGGVVMDKRPIASVRRIIEYYPVAKKKKEEVPEVPSAPVEVAETKQEPVVETPIAPEIKEAAVEESSAPIIETPVTFAEQEVKEPVIEAEVPVAPAIPEVKEVVPEAPAPLSRESAIEFLVSKKMNRAKMLDKSDDELKRLLKVYGK